MVAAVVCAVLVEAIEGSRLQVTDAESENEVMAAEGDIEAAVFTDAVAELTWCVYELREDVDVDEGLAVNVRGKLSVRV
jgi:hypothetical protein